MMDIISDKYHLVGFLQFLIFAALFAVAAAAYIKTPAVAVSSEETASSELASSEPSGSTSSVYSATTYSATVIRTCFYDLIRNIFKYDFIIFRLPNPKLMMKTTKMMRTAIILMRMRPKPFTPLQPTPLQLLTRFQLTPLRYTKLLTPNTNNFPFNLLCNEIFI